MPYYFSNFALQSAICLPGIVCHSPLAVTNNITYAHSTNCWINSGWFNTCHAIVLNKLEFQLNFNWISIEFVLKLGWISTCWLLALLKWWLNFNFGGVEFQLKFNSISIYAFFARFGWTLLVWLQDWSCVITIQYMCMNINIHSQEDPPW